MQIRNMFAEDINRPINGVIKVDQDTADVIEQEVREYVITRELKKHFISFFDYYSDSFDKPTDDIGVWISGFFGSGKSHFLKMLSYILENKPVGTTTTVEMFRKKFEDDPATFMLIDKATRGKTETILFNIDIEGSINKDKTAVLRVFAKMFYNHLGFFGENLKVAMLEQYIDQLGKTEEFRRVFEEKKGKSWVDQRKAFAFNGKFIIPTLMEVLDVFVMIGLYAGLRREEILALKWDSVFLDVEHPYLKVQRAWHTEHNRPVILTELKTSAAKREVPIPNCLVECLKEAKANSHSDYVVANSEGQPLSYTQFKRIWQYIVTRSTKQRTYVRYINGKKIKHTVTPVLGEKAAHNGEVVYSMDFQVTPHMLRHTYITNLIYAQVDPKTVQYLAGHKNSKITMDIYAKVKYNKPKELSAVVNNAFGQW